MSDWLAMHSPDRMGGWGKCMEGIAEGGDGWMVGWMVE